MTLTEAAAELTRVTNLSDVDIEVQLEETIAFITASERIHRAEMDVMIRHALLQEYNRMCKDK